MFRPLLVSTLALSLLPTPLLVQDLKSFGNSGTRAEAAMFIAEVKGSEFVGAYGAAFITYGQPDWKSEWTQEQIDTMTKGKINRLGRDNWASLDISCPTSIGDTTIPAGVWYLAISRSADGATWNLVVIDPVKAKAAGAWPFMADNAPRTYEIPMKHEVTTGDLVQKLTVKLTPTMELPTHGTLTIAWGNHKLENKVDLKGSKPAAKDASAPKKEGEAKKY